MEKAENTQILPKAKNTAGDSKICVNDNKIRLVLSIKSKIWHICTVKMFEKLTFKIFTSIS